MPYECCKMLSFCFAIRFLFLLFVHFMLHVTALFIIITSAFDIISILIINTFNSELKKQCDKNVVWCSVLGLIIDHIAHQLHKLNQDLSQLKYNFTNQSSTNKASR